eukprot:757225-Hanusia_phi.AAC.1
MMSQDPLNKEAFDLFFGKSPSVSPVPSNSNLMLDFNIASNPAEWIDEFEAMDWMKNCDLDRASSSSTDCSDVGRDESSCFVFAPLRNNPF